ncbi:TPA: hypothetical protein DF272_05755 [Candidatus Falkowbacteria bacterium]|nr:hypothetical protein [Candidatus Falkowbacteria bacterium]
MSGVSDQNDFEDNGAMDDVVVEPTGEEVDGQPPTNGREIHNLFSIKRVFLYIPNEDDPYARVEKGKTASGKPVIRWITHTKKVLELTGKHMVVKWTFFGDAEPGDAVICDLLIQNVWTDDHGFIPRIQLNQTPQGMTPRLILNTEHGEHTEMAFFIAPGFNTAIKFQYIESPAEADELIREIYDQYRK